MNRPYFDVVDTIFIECSVCGSVIPYTHLAVETHDEKCPVPDGFRAKKSKTGSNASGRRIVPPPPRRVTE